jgi:hypothetical protein
MVCSVCGERNFVAGEYRAGHCRAPALQCSACGALNLSERAARSPEERESVKIAMAVRSAMMDHHAGESGPPSAA